MTHRFKTHLSALALAIGVQPALGIDTDIYTVGAASSNSAPNVLFMIDNSANWTSQGGGMPKKEIEHEALYKFMDNLQARLSDGDASTDVALNYALMATNHSNSPRGGKVLQHFSRIDADNIATIFDAKSLLYCNPNAYKNNESSLLALCADHTASGGEWNMLTFAGTENIPTSNTSKYATMFLEARQYFAGAQVRSGKTDGDEDPAAFNGNSYRSPIQPNGDDPEGEVCGKNYIVFLGNGAPANGENTEAEQGLVSLGASREVVRLSPSNYESSWADEYSRYLAKADVRPDLPGTQSIKTYVVDVFDPIDEKNNAPTRAAHALMQSIAEQGQGSYFEAADVDTIVERLTSILDEILAVNDVFAASSLPVSVNVRGTNLNQVYIGVFRPDAKGRPGWSGNMKMYRLSVNAATGAVFLADADGEIAADTNTGFIKSSARSFWTHGSSFWQHLSADEAGDGGISDSPDGELVEKGAVAQQVRNAGYAARKVYTCLDCTENTDLTATAQRFTAANAGLSADRLGVASGGARGDLIDWVRGRDVLDENEDGSTTDVRPSMHGDVLHSRPAVVNYGDHDNNPDTPDLVYVFYGSNNGHFHAVRGGENESQGSIDGQEQWSFIPEEHLPQLKTMYENETLNAGIDKPFFVDGDISSYVETVDVNGDGIADKTSKVYLYLNMRRGGDFIYALDVTDPHSPKMMWKKKQGDTGLNELGQTWSAPAVSRIRGYANPVLILGLGYDPSVDDLAPNAPGSAAPFSNRGRGLVVLDAFTGKPIWQVGYNPQGAAANADSSIDATPANSPVNLHVADMRYSVPADPTVIDRDRDGYADRIYFGDTGGQLWRVDIFAENRAEWSVNKLLSVGDRRKFLSAPDVTESQVKGAKYDIVLIGSGDREAPFDESVENKYLAYFDYAQGVTTSTAMTLSLDNLANVTDSSVFAHHVNRANGWYFDLAPGEKVTTKSTAIGGTAFFNTFQPSQSGSCSSGLGTARSYQVDVENSKARSDNDGDGSLDDGDRSYVVDGGGFLPDPVAVIVDIDGTLREAVVSGPQVETPNTTPLGKRTRVFVSEE